MPECDYCDASFDEEDAYLDHLAAEHEGELGRIDRRRVADRRREQGLDVPPTVIYAVGGIALLALVAGAVYYLVGVFGGPEPIEGGDEHGTIELVIDGNRTNFDQPRYRDPPGHGFHFHRGAPETWHMEPADGQRMTLSEAMAQLGIELTETRLVIDGEEYDAAQPGVELTVEVDGEPVDPEERYLYGAQNPANSDQGDHVYIEVQTSN